MAPSRADAILEYIEGSEYRRELARQIAASLVAEFDAGTFAAGDYGQVQALIGALSQALADSGVVAEAITEAVSHLDVLGMQESSVYVGQGLEELVAKAYNTVAEEAALQISARASELTRTVQRMMDTGVNVQALLANESSREAFMAPLSAAVKQSATGIVSAVENSILRAGAEVHSQLAKVTTVPAAPNVYITPSQVETYKAMGGETVNALKGGDVLRGTLMSAADLPQNEYWHVTTNLPAVEKSGMLLGKFEGETAGLGKGTSAAHWGVSLTANEDTAKMIERELLRAGELSRDPASFADMLPAWAAEDASISGADASALAQKADAAISWFASQDSQTASNALDAFNQYLMGRDSVPNAPENPILYLRPEQAVNITPDNTGILTIPKDSIPPDALVRTHPIGDHLDEVMVHADIPVDAGDTEDTTGTEEPLFSWETRQDDKVCDDAFENSCAPRHGEEHTLDEWDQLGQPQGENLICTMYAKGAYSNCRCVLLPAEATGRLPQPVDISEAVKAGRTRAKDQVSGGQFERVVAEAASAHGGGKPQPEYTQTVELTLRNP